MVKINWGPILVMGILKIVFSEIRAAFFFFFSLVLVRSLNSLILLWKSHVNRHSQLHPFFIGRGTAQILSFAVTRIIFLWVQAFHCVLLKFRLLAVHLYNVCVRSRLESGMTIPSLYQFKLITSNARKTSQVMATQIGAMGTILHARFVPYFSSEQLFFVPFFPPCYKSQTRLLIEIGVWFLCWVCQIIMMIAFSEEHLSNVYILIARKEEGVTVQPTFNVSVIFGKRDEVSWTVMLYVSLIFHN